MVYTKNVRVWVRSIPVHEQVFWCVAMIVAIALCLSAAIALWRFGFLGGIVVGFCLMKLIK